MTVSRSPAGSRLIRRTTCNKIAKTRFGLAEELAQLAGEDLFKLWSGKPAAGCIARSPLLSLLKGAGDVVAINPSAAMVGEGRAHRLAIGVEQLAGERSPVRI